MRMQLVLSAEVRSSRCHFVYTFGPLYSLQVRGWWHPCTWRLPIIEYLPISVIAVFVPSPGPLIAIRFPRVRHAIFLNAPVPVWGIVGIHFFADFCRSLRGTQRFRGLGDWQSFLPYHWHFSGYSVVLAFISSFYIGAYCIVCIYTYAVNFLLAYMTWLVRKRFESKDSSGH